MKNEPAARKLRIAYLSHPPHHAFVEAAEADPALELDRIPLDLPDGEIMKRLAACDGYYVMAARDELPIQWHLTPALLARLPRLMLAVSYGAGHDTVDLAACTEAGVGIVAQHGGNAQGVAEHAVGLMLTLMKRIPEAHAALRAGQAAVREDFLGRELSGRTVGIVGLGHVGTRVAEILKAFRCRVLAVDPYLDAGICAARGARKVLLPELLAESDVISLHCPLTAETRGMFDAKAFAAMRPGAVFVTTARGGIHDEAALLAALREGRVAGAGLDVWAREPPPADHPLLSHPAVLASPHTAGVTAESRERVARMAAEAFCEFAAGQVPPRLVNPEVTERMMARWLGGSPASVAAPKLHTT
jgi:D-3-phosphoglycerate dehydrogenase